MRAIFLRMIIRFMQNNLIRENSRLAHIRATIAEDEALLERYKRELMILETSI